MIKGWFEALSSREKLLTLIAGLSLFLFALYFGVVEPVHKIYAAKTKTLAMLELEKSKLAMLIRMEKENRPKMEIALKKRESLENRLALAKDNIMDGSRLNDILKLLSDPGAGHDIILAGLSIDSKPIVKSLDRAGKPEAMNVSRFTPATDRETPHAAASKLKYNRNQITIKIKSGFGSLAHLFRKLFDGPLPLSISKLSVIRDDSPDDPGILARIELVVYTSPL